MLIYCEERSRPNGGIDRNYSRENWQKIEGDYQNKQSTYFGSLPTLRWMISLLYLEVVIFCGTKVSFLLGSFSRSWWSLDWKMTRQVQKNVDKSRIHLEQVFRRWLFPLWWQTKGDSFFVEFPIILSIFSSIRMGNLRGQKEQKNWNTHTVNSYTIIINKWSFFHWTWRLTSYYCLLLSFFGLILDIFKKFYWSFRPF